MPNDDIQTQDLSSTPATPTAEPVASSEDQATDSQPVDTNAGDNENAYLEDLIADADNDEDLEAGETPGGAEDGGSGQATADGQSDDGSPAQPNTAGEGAEASPATEPSQDGQQPPASQAAPEATPQVEQPPQAQQPEGAPQTTEDFNTQFNQFFEQRVQDLAQNVYALDDATKEALDSEPSTVIPQLAGRLHMQVLTTALAQVSQMLPVTLQEFSSQNVANQKAEDAFYEQWDSLKEHSQTVEQVAAVYMQMNPGVDQKKAITDIGTMVSVQLGIPIAPPTTTPATQQTQPQAQPVALTPPVPASAAGGAAQTQQPNQPTTWLTDWVQSEE